MSWAAAWASRVVAGVGVMRHRPLRVRGVVRPDARPTTSSGRDEQIRAAELRIDPAGWPSSMAMMRRASCWRASNWRTAVPISGLNACSARMRDEPAGALAVAAGSRALAAGEQAGQPARHLVAGRTARRPRATARGCSGSSVAYRSQVRLEGSSWPSPSCHGPVPGTSSISTSSDTVPARFSASGYRRPPAKNALGRCGGVGQRQGQRVGARSWPNRSTVGACWRRTGELAGDPALPGRWLPARLQAGLELGVPADAVADDVDQLGGAGVCGRGPRCRRGRWRMLRFRMAFSARKRCSMWVSASSIRCGALLAGPSRPIGRRGGWRGHNLRRNVSGELHCAVAGLLCGEPGIRQPAALDEVLQFDLGGDLRGFHIRIQRAYQHVDRLIGGAQEHFAIRDLREFDQQLEVESAPFVQPGRCRRKCHTQRGSRDPCCRR